MKIWTYAELKSQIEKEMDIAGEDFIEADELIGYFNDAIDKAEAIILKLNEDYLLTSKDLNLVQGQSDYRIPNKILANKIRAILYNNGSEVYPIKRVRRMDKFEHIEHIKQYGESADYQYYLKHDSANKGTRIILVPASRETSSGNVTVHFIRDANRIPLSSEATQTEIDETKIDLPEAKQYIMKYVELRILKKDKDLEGIAVAKKELLEERRDLEGLLTPQVEDDDNTVQEDFSAYYEHS